MAHVGLMLRAVEAIPRPFVYVVGRVAYWKPPPLGLYQGAMYLRRLGKKSRQWENTSTEAACEQGDRADLRRGTELLAFALFAAFAAYYGALQWWRAKDEHQERQYLLEDMESQVKLLTKTTAEQKMVMDQQEELLQELVKRTNILHRRLKRLDPAGTKLGKPAKGGPVELGSRGDDDELFKYVTPARMERAKEKDEASPFTKQNASHPGAGPGGIPMLGNSSGGLEAIKMTGREGFAKHRDGGTEGVAFTTANPPDLRRWAASFSH